MRLFFSFLTLILCLEGFTHENYRQYNENSPEHIKAFYYQNHTKQTMILSAMKRAEYLQLKRGKMGVWDAMALLNTIVDDSDPDISLTQTYHAFQTAEALRRDNQPRWLILVGLVHDLGKILLSYDEPSYLVVGDTFPLGCSFAKEIVFHEYFAENPDMKNTVFQSKLGLYKPHIGLDNVVMSWGHDEYLYQVMKDFLPKEASYIIRYHSFYAHHKEGAYDHLLSEYDRKMLPYLKLFSQYDLYSKVNVPIDVEELRPYYEELTREFLPEELNW